MASERHCCSVPAVKSDYEAVGTLETIGDLPLYRVGEKTDKAIIVLYDVFGLQLLTPRSSNNTKQFCDVLSKCSGYQVIMPDFFRGKLWEEKDLGDMTAFREWLGQFGNYEVIAPQVAQVKEHLISEGVTKTSLVGFCWGAKMAILLSGEDTFYCSTCLIHPSLLEVKDAEAALAPLLMITSIEESNLSDFMDVLYKKPFGDKCKHVHFDDVHHGFAAARGNWSEGSVDRKRATEAIQLTVDYFNTYM
ncbi:hypothetical protein Unana1_05629 [Umbelopsis nana]